MRINGSLLIAATGLLAASNHGSADQPDDVISLAARWRFELDRMDICGFDLTSEAAQNPVSRQMVASLMKHMRSPMFAPETKFAPLPEPGLLRDERKGL